MSEPVSQQTQTGIKLSVSESYRTFRQVKDTITRYLMTFGGISVIIAIVLIAIYLVWVVIPLFLPAHMGKVADFSSPGSSTGNSLYFALEEQREIAMQVRDDGTIIFFNTSDGNVIGTETLPAATDVDVISFAAGSPTSRLLGFGMDDGSVVLRYHQYNVSYPDDIRVITPQVFGPFDGRPVVIDDNGSAIVRFAVQGDDNQTTIAALTEDSRLLLVNLTVESNFLTGEETVNKSTTSIPLQGGVHHLIMDVDHNELYVLDDENILHYYDIRNKQSPVLVQSLPVVDDDIDVTAMSFLSGGISILIGDSSGAITQWFPVRDEDNEYSLQKIRAFNSQTSPIIQIVPEYFRKGFVALDNSGEIGIYHATAHRTVKLQQLDTAENGILAIAPRANGLVVGNTGSGIEIWNLENEHPEVSWSSLWGKVWYENRGGPEYIWQSSSASSIFEPKFSLTPLAFGTLKASLYAMIFAIPLSIMGAIYTAYFMSAGLRNVVKPTIEIMAALPTVILGFLAGLWFA
ncbi:MAG: phosphate ABC transporter permease, partial [Gammaproteobacteria bacterium]|nr:phosphate ABC transporter permease [Gammaproteobacteria bacterium]